jgi:hypothetical protein
MLVAEHDISCTLILRPSGNHSYALILCAGIDTDEVLSEKTLQKLAEGE